MAKKTTPPPPTPGVYIIEDDQATAELLEKVLSSRFRDRLVVVACRDNFPLRYEGPLQVHWVILNPETIGHPMKSIVDFISSVFGPQARIILHSDDWGRHANGSKVLYGFAYRDIAELLSLIEHLSSVS